MALRSVTIAGDTPVAITLDEHVSFLQADAELAEQLAGVLGDEGWQIDSLGDMPGRTLTERLGAAERGAMLAVDVARAFRGAVTAQVDEMTARLQETREAIRDLEAELLGVAELRDLVIDELGRGAVEAAAAATRWEAVWVSADRAGFVEEGGELRRWLADVAAAEAPLDPVASDLIAARDAAERRWEAVACGDVDRIPAVVAKRDDRDRLREQIEELEGLALEGFGDEVTARIEEAHTRRLEAEGRRGRPPVDERDREASILERYGFGTYPEYQIAKATGTLRDHVSSLLPELRSRLTEADDALAAAVGDGERLVRDVEAERDSVMERIDAFAGSTPLEEFLAAPVAADRLLDRCAALTEDLTVRTAELEAELSRLEAAHDELIDESVVREAELVSAEKLLADLRGAIEDLAVRQSETLGRVGEALRDTSLPGLLLRAHADQVQLDALQEMFREAAGQIVVLSPEDPS